jgi:cellobiose phosphorylase
VLPERWTGFTAVRRFRGVAYHINVHRQGPGNEVTLSVDGKPVAGCVVPLPPAGIAEVAVEVKLGKA